MGRNQRLKEAKRKHPAKPQDISKAIRNGNVKQIKKLGKFDVNHSISDDGCTPLHIAAYVGNLDVVRYLAGEAHADVNQAKTDDGFTPLLIAAQN